MAPVVHGLEAEYYGKIKFAFLDADDPATQPFQREFGFRAQPEYYLVDGNGQVIKKWVGFVPADDFRSIFKQTLGE
jgi:thioredoxin-like negative regulator of GroEL